MSKEKRQGCGLLELAVPDAHLGHDCPALAGLSIRPSLYRRRTEAGTGPRPRTRTELAPRTPGPPLRALLSVRWELGRRASGSSNGRRGRRCMSPGRLLPSLLRERAVRSGALHSRGAEPALRPQPLIAGHLLPTHPPPPSGILEALSPGPSHLSSPHLSPPSLRPQLALSPQQGPPSRGDPPPRRPRPAPAIGCRPRHSRAGPAGATRAVGGGRAEPGFLKEPLASCCVTVGRWAVGSPHAGRPPDTRGQAASSHCVPACSAAGPCGRRSLSPQSPLGDPDPGQARFVTLGLPFVRPKVGVRLAIICSSPK